MGQYSVVDQIIFQPTLLSAQIIVSGIAGLSGTLVALNANKGIVFEREKRLSMIACQDLYVVGAL